jgi:uncharacterized repeat protein (TIGR02543 family)
MWLGYAASPTLRHLWFSGNQASQFGGGMYANNSSPLMSYITFSGNQAGNQGGGMCNANLSYPTLVNAIFTGNLAVNNGGGMSNMSSDPTLVNVTFAGNTTNTGGAIYNNSSSPSLTNCILWGNAPQQIYSQYASPTISYSIVQGGYTGDHNLDADPLFVAPVSASLAPTSAGNYRLRYGSPAIDAGLSSAISETEDLDGKPRLVDGSGGSSPVVDMGAYEWQRYLLTVNKVGSGVLTRNPDYPAFTTFDSAVLTATASLGWNFVGWSGDLVSSANPLFVPITGNTTLTATFSQNTYLLNVSIVGAGHVSKLPNQASYPYGTVITLTATADPGWSFSGWSGDVINSSNPLTLTITSNTNIVANFITNWLYLPLVNKFRVP